MARAVAEIQEARIGGRIGHAGESLHGVAEPMRPVRLEHGLQPAGKRHSGIRHGLGGREGLFGQPGYFCGEGGLGPGEELP